jgi:hypothetical protein
MRRHFFTLLVTAICSALVFTPGAFAGKTPTAITEVDVFAAGTAGGYCFFDVATYYSGRVSGRPSERQIRGGVYYYDNVTWWLAGSPGTFTWQLEPSPAFAQMAPCRTRNWRPWDPAPWRSRCTSTTPKARSARAFGPRTSRRTGAARRPRRARPFRRFRKRSAGRGREVPSAPPFRPRSSQRFRPCGRRNAGCGGMLRRSAPDGNALMLHHRYVPRRREPKRSTPWAK